MLILLSPAKSLNFEKQGANGKSTQPLFREESQQLVNKLKRTSKKELRSLMKISQDLADLNARRYRQFSYPFTPDNAKPALLTFRGDVYQGLEAWTLSDEELDFAQDHLRILSGLFGLLRPRDLIQPYRLEMGTKLKVRRKKNLYEFWGDKITEAINRDMEEKGYDAVINLASNEYFSAVNTDKLKGRIYNIAFKEYRNGELRYIQFNMKKARGLMSRFIIEHRIEDPAMLRGFDYDGYHFEEELSGETEFLFVK